VTNRETKQPVVPCYIVTPTGGFEKNEDKVYRVQASDLDTAYERAGYQQRERSYNIKYQHWDYTVICNEYRNDDIGGEPIVIIPEFLFPRRPYMAEVYLYAIDLYSATPEKGQRWAAEETRKKFNLPTFAHTTLGRALKTFVHNINEAENTSEDQGGEAGKEAEQLNAEAPENGGCGHEIVNRAFFRTVGSTQALRKAAANVLGGRLAGGSLEKITEYSYDLVRAWFLRYRRLLL
jgi:hypothetical protein